MAERPVLLTAVTARQGAKAFDAVAADLREGLIIDRSSFAISMRIERRPVHSRIRDPSPLLTPIWHGAYARDGRSQSN
jgi:hypothetical protein